LSHKNTEEEEEEEALVLVLLNQAHMFLLNGSQ
jgi:hypothetical protein